MSVHGEESTSTPRQRVSRACDLCRRKKVKCDGASPVCTNCKSVGLECTFKDMTKKRGPPKGYIEAIENRLYKLENFLGNLAKTGHMESKELLSELNSPLETPGGEQIRARPIRRVPKSEKTKVFFWQQDKAGKRKRESLLDQNPNESSHPPLENESESEPGDEFQEEEVINHYKKKNKREQEGEQSVDEGVGQLSMDENGQVRYLGKSSGYYLLQNSKTYRNGAFHFANYGHRSKSRKTYSTESIDPLELPPKDLSAHLIQLYFKHFYPFLPMFYKRHLSSTVDHPTIQPVTPLLLNAIYAVASRISPDIRVRSDPAADDTAGDVFFERAKKLLDESYDQPSISTVQALLLLASHQHGAMKSARAWLYSGMAFRMAQDLGLHRNCDHWNIPPEECERRKRVFWCCYIVDRLTSAMYGRASTFEERDCDIPFPSVDDDEPSDKSEPQFRLLETFINLIKICDILGHVLKTIYYVRSLQYTGVRQADSVLTAWNKKLHQWKDQLPESLQIKKTNDKQVPSIAVCQLHMIYHTTVILLHRPFISGPTQSLVPSLLPCASICTAAADSVISTAMSMLSENKLRYVMNYATYYIFTAAIIFIKDSCIKNGSDERKPLDAKIKARQCMQALEEMETTWINASKGYQILAELSGLREMDFNFQKNPDSWPDQDINYLQQQPQLFDRQSTLQQQQQEQRHQRQQQFADYAQRSIPNYLRPPSPQSSHSSPQLQHEIEQIQKTDTSKLKNPSSSNYIHRTNSSNLRFPIIRANLNSDHGYDDGSKSLYSSSSFTPNIDFAIATPFGNSNVKAVNNSSTMDPFAAPGSIPVPSPKQYDPFSASFWGVPSSLDINEWNNFMSDNLGPQASNDPLYGTSTCLQDRQFYESTLNTNDSSTNLMHDLIPEKQHLIHTDQNVDVLTGVSLPHEESQNNTVNNSTLINYLP